MKIINLPSLKVMRLKRVKIYLHSVRKFTAVYGGGEGGSGEKGGGGGGVPPPPCPYKRR